MSAPSVSELDSNNIENAVVLTPHGYEWVLGLAGTQVNGRKLIPHTEDGSLVEMVSAMGNYYQKSVETLLSESLEVLGYADNQEEAGSLAEEHYLAQQND